MFSELTNSEIISQTKTAQNFADNMTKLEPCRQESILNEFPSSKLVELMRQEDGINIILSSMQNSDNQTNDLKGFIIDKLSAKEWSMIIQNTSHLSLILKFYNKLQSERILEKIDFQSTSTRMRLFTSGIELENFLKEQDVKAENKTLVLEELGWYFLGHTLMTHSPLIDAIRPYDNPEKYVDINEARRFQEKKSQDQNPSLANICISTGDATTSVLNYHKKAAPILPNDVDFFTGRVHKVSFFKQEGNNTQSTPTSLNDDPCLIM
ncbi:MAG: hypothetical protein P1U74_01400 [Legionellaceae bacterium]|nr:hypothetical protein [Legionellaceae bacterium]